MILRNYISIWYLVTHMLRKEKSKNSHQMTIVFDNNNNKNDNCFFQNLITNQEQKV